ncbi:MAG: hypothetical protein WAK33_25880 [Silvibacterium sp.]
MALVSLCRGQPADRTQAQSNSDYPRDFARRDHFSRWEIADIGVLVVFRRAGAVLRTKIGLLQSKRLYPDEQTVEAEAHPMDYYIGFGRFMHSDSEFRSAARERTFSFSLSSVYRALGYQSDQYNRVLEYQQQEGIPVHYMLYNHLGCR